MRVVIFLISVFLLITTARAQVIGPKFVWARSGNFSFDSTRVEYFPPKQSIAGYKGFVLWATPQNGPSSVSQSPAYGPVELALYDSSGIVKAINTIKGKLYVIDLQSDGDGNWYLLGRFIDTVIFPNGKSLINTFADENQQYFIARLNFQSLDADWVSRTTAKGPYNNVNCFTLGEKGVYYPADTGYFSDITNVYKLDYVTGVRTHLLRQNIYGITTAIQVADDGDIYLTGSWIPSAGTWSFGGTTTTQPIVPVNSKLSYINRYRPDGTFAWIKWWNEKGLAAYRILRKGPSRSMFYSGRLQDSITISGYQFQKPIRPDSADFLIMRLDSTGSIIWAKQRIQNGTPQGNIYMTRGAVREDRIQHASVSDSTLYFCPETSGTSIWGGGVTAGAGPARNATVVAYGMNGAPKWAKAVGGYYSEAQKVASHSGWMWICGFGSDTAALKFDNISLPMGSTLYKPYLAALKLRADPAGIREAELYAEADLIRVWPNPAKDYISIMFPVVGRFRLLDISGKVVRAQTVAEREIACTLELEHLPRGIYFAELTACDGNVYVQRVVLE